MIVASLLPNINELFDWRSLAGGDTLLAFNKTALMAFVSTFICIAIFWTGSRKQALVPTGIQNVAEMGYDMIEENVSVAAMGEEGKGWTPYFATLFFWIFFINIWSIIPGIQFPATARIAIPLILALLSWATFIGVGLIRQGPAYFWNSINQQMGHRRQRWLKRSMQQWTIYRPCGSSLRRKGHRWLCLMY